MIAKRLMDKERKDQEQRLQLRPDQLAADDSIMDDNQTVSFMQGQHSSRVTGEITLGDASADPLNLETSRMMPGN
jgi:hypothetical protein